MENLDCVVFWVNILIILLAVFGDQNFVRRNYELKKLFFRVFNLKMKELLMFVQFQRKERVCFSAAFHKNKQPNKKSETVCNLCKDSQTHTSTHTNNTNNTADTTTQLFTRLCAEPAAMMNLQKTPAHDSSSILGTDSIIWEWKQSGEEVTEVEHY